MNKLLLWEHIFEVANFLLLIAALSYGYKRWGSGIIKAAIEEKEKAYKINQAIADKLEENIFVLEQSVYYDQDYRRKLLENIKKWQKAVVKSSEHSISGCAREQKSFKEYLALQQHHLEIAAIQKETLSDALKKVEQDWIKTFHASDKQQQYMTYIQRDLDQAIEVYRG